MDSLVVQSESMSAAESTPMDSAEFLYLPAEILQCLHDVGA